MRSRRSSARSPKAMRQHATRGQLPTTPGHCGSKMQESPARGHKVLRECARPSRSQGHHGVGPTGPATATENGATRSPQSGLEHTPPDPRANCFTLPHCHGAAGSGTRVVCCRATLRQQALEVVLHTAPLHGDSRQWNFCHTPLHCLGIAGSGTPATHWSIALGQWAIELLQYTGDLPRGSGQWCGVVRYGLVWCPKVYVPCRAHVAKDCHSLCRWAVARLTLGRAATLLDGATALRAGPKPLCLRFLRPALWHLRCFSIVPHSVVWCGVVWCGVVWCGVVWCGVVWCGVVWCGVPKALLPKGKRPGCLPTGKGKRAGLCVLCARRA